MHSRHLHQLATAVLLVTGATLASGCSIIDLKRTTYDLLRQDDCRRNDVDSFCSRSFVFEYDEYALIREEYLRRMKAGKKTNQELALSWMGTPVEGSLNDCPAPYYCPPR